MRASGNDNGFEHVLLFHSFSKSFTGLPTYLLLLSTLFKRVGQSGNLGDGRLMDRCVESSSRYTFIGHHGCCLLVIPDEDVLTVTPTVKWD